MKHFLILLLCFFTLPAWSGLGEKFTHEFKEVLIDLRNSRGGNGDVAAGYLTLMSLLTDYQVQNHITLLVDTEGQKRLSTLLSENHPLPSNVEIHSLETIDKTLSIDLYMAMASPSGTLKNKPHQDLKFSQDAILLIQTVLGNTENPHSLNPMGLIQVNDIKINMDPAGIGTNEAGIYGDYVAAYLRGKSGEESRQFLLREIGAVTQESTRRQLESILTQKSLQGSRTGLVYGITSGKTRPQFTSYLKGLAQHDSESFCLVTPSKFDLSFIDDIKLRERIVLLDRDSALPAVAEAGKIYILTTPNLPHPVFVGLTHFSMKQGVTPVGAGDGFMSAAIILGEPFVLTRVPWNENNIQNLKRLLQRQYSGPSEKISELFHSIYDEIKFERALELQEYKSLYTKLSQNTLRLTDSIVKSAIGVKNLVNESSLDLNNKKHAESRLRLLGLSLQEKKEVGKIDSSSKAETDFIKKSVSDSMDLPAEVKAKILGYYSKSSLGATETAVTVQCSQALR